MSSYSPLENLPTEVIREILSYVCDSFPGESLFTDEEQLPEEDDIHRVCAVSSRLLNCSPHLVYNCGGQSLLGKRTADGVRLVHEEERLRHRILRQLGAYGYRCQSLTILSHDGGYRPRISIHSDSVMREQSQELFSYRLDHLMRLAKLHKATITGFHAPSCYIPDLENRLIGFMRLENLTIQSSQNLDLRYYQELRKLTVFHRLRHWALKVSGLPRLEQLTLHFDPTPFISPAGPTRSLVDLNTLPNLRCLELFAGRRLSRKFTVPLTFIDGMSASLTRVRICGTFQIEHPRDLLEVITAFGPQLEVFSLARVRGNFGRGYLGQTAYLPCLRALELHDVDPDYIPALSLPSLQKLAILYQDHLNLHKCVTALLHGVGDDLRTLSVTSGETASMSTSFQLVPPDLVAEILRCLRLERFSLFGPFWFERRDWRTLSHRMFCDMASVYVRQQRCLDAPQEIRDLCVTDFAEEPSTEGLVSIANGRCVVRATEPDEGQALIHFSPLGRWCLLRRFLALADPEGEMSFAIGDLPRLCRTSRAVNDVQKKDPMYSGPPLLTDTAWYYDREVIEVPDDHEGETTSVEYETTLENVEDVTANVD